MHELLLFEMCLHMFGLSTKHLLACFDVRRITISYENIRGFLSSIFCHGKHGLCSGNISPEGYVHSNYAVLVIHNNPEICKLLAALDLNKLLICMPYIREAYTSRVALQQTGKLLHPGENRYVTHREIQSLTNHERGNTRRDKKRAEHSILYDFFRVSASAKEAKASF